MGDRARHEPSSFLLWLTLSVAVGSVLFLLYAVYLIGR
jgi:hypothetical protein